MYNSPIRVFVSDMEQNLREEGERCIFEAVQRVGVTVDKEALEKALAYDRRQYENGYREALIKIRDGLWNMIETISKELGET